MKLSCANGLITRLQKYFDKKGCASCAVTANPIVFSQVKKVVEVLPTYEELKLELDEVKLESGRTIELQNVEIEFLKAKLENIKKVKSDFDASFAEVV